MPYKNEDKRKAYQKEYNKRTWKKYDRPRRDRHRKDVNPVGVMFWRVKHNAKKRGLEFSITKEDIKFPEVCPIFGIKFDYDSPKYTPSLDRVDNTKGYVPGNVRVISKLANTIKRDLTVDMAKRLIDYMEGRI